MLLEGNLHWHERRHVHLSDPLTVGMMFGSCCASSYIMADIMRRIVEENEENCICSKYSLLTWNYLRVYSITSKEPCMGESKQTKHHYI